MTITRVLAVQGEKENLFEIRAKRADRIQVCNKLLIGAGWERAVDELGADLQTVSTEVNNIRTSAS